MGLQLCCVQTSTATEAVTDGKLEATAAERNDSSAAAAAAGRSINSYVEDRTVPATVIQELIDEGLTTSTSSDATVGTRLGAWTNIPVEPSIPSLYPASPFRSIHFPSTPFPCPFLPSPSVPLPPLSPLPIAPFSFQSPYLPFQSPYLPTSFPSLPFLSLPIPNTFLHLASLSSTL